ncbi:tol-pal system protein YbgF [Desulfovibrio sp. OttesenSCG-928-A18]|nr:tol-pal system protein YbgF [Desulfovibrio sp. OttesenSCG-928-A18]
MRQHFLKIVCLLACVVQSACVSTGGGTGNLTARVDRHEQQIQGLLSQVGQVEQVLPGQAEMWAQMQTMRQELNMLHGKLDELQGGGQGGELAYLRDKVSRLEAVVRQMGSQLAINVDSLNSAPYTPPAAQPQPVFVPPSATNPTTQGAGGAVITPAAPTNTADALYDAGIKAFDQRRYKDAVVAFKDFTTSFPGHKLASNAYFWEGESYFQMQDYARAALAYQEVISKHPGSPKLQSAMLKQGISLYNANKKTAGRERLQELVKRYPSSPEATRAKQFLATNK